MVRKDKEPLVQAVSAGGLHFIYTKPTDGGNHEDLTSFSILLLLTLALGCSKRKVDLEAEMKAIRSEVAGLQTSIK